MEDEAFNKTKLFYKYNKITSFLKKKTKYKHKWNSLLSLPLSIENKRNQTHVNDHYNDHKPTAPFQFRHIHQIYVLNHVQWY